VATVNTCLRDFVGAYRLSRVISTPFHVTLATPHSGQVTVTSAIRSPYTIVRFARAPAFELQYAVCA
jgi:hypothetical protein